MKPASEMGWPQGFVYYNEADLATRKYILTLFTRKLSTALTDLNRAVRFFQVETPMLTFKDALKGHEATGFELVKASFAKHGEDTMYLRPETTFGTYAAFRAMWPQEPERKKQMPICLWQYGKSFRDEQARPMKELRFREFYQLEYQLFFSSDTKANYFDACLATTFTVVELICRQDPIRRPVPEKDLAHYSLKTTDLFIPSDEDFKEIEVAAISQRKDFEGANVVEISIGLDRLTALSKAV